MGIRTPQHSLVLIAQCNTYIRVSTPVLDESENIHVDGNGGLGKPYRTRKVETGCYCLPFEDKAEQHSNDFAWLQWSMLLSV